MSEFRPGPPPPEAYSRVTNPERFRPLHNAALSLLDTVTDGYDVERRERTEEDVSLRYPNARPTILLTPSIPTAAPLAVAFTSFPGLLVRAGRWARIAIPPCGCDACDETAESAIEELAWLVECVTHGHFRESIDLPLDGDAWHQSQWGPPQGRRSGGGSRISRDKAVAMLGSGPATHEWHPWPLR